jgi:twitching motility protein PilT
MAILDGLLESLLADHMDQLILAPGRPPRYRDNGVDSDITSQPLDGEIILNLVAEVAPDGAVPEAKPGSRWRFVYTHQGNDFEFLAACTPQGWMVAASPRRPPAIANAEPETAPAVTAPTSTVLHVVAPPEPPRATEPGAVPPIVELLQAMLTRRASDLHLTSGLLPRMRLDGDLMPLEQWGRFGTTELTQRLIDIMPQRNAEEFRAINDTDFAHEIGDLGRFRVNIFRDRQGVGAVFRHIPIAIPTFEDLGLPESLRQVANLSKGLVLVTGPTGSGKSTTLAAIVDLINKSRHDHVITIEDPIEFVHTSDRCLVNQREVGEHTGSFQHALRAALREDPDIVLVGEMRDLETMQTAIQTAETGHLVFGTLHTTTAPGTVERLIGGFPGELQAQIRMMLAESLRAVVSQTLLKKIGGGRVAAFEVLFGTPAVTNLIREGKTFQIASAMQTGKKVGMSTLTDSLFDLVHRKLVDPMEAYTKAVFKEALLGKFDAAGIRLDIGRAADKADAELAMA